MEDDNIVSILKRDESMPNIPRDEWTQLSTKIEVKKRVGFMKPLALVFSFGIFLLTFNMQSVDVGTNKVTDEQLYEFVMSDSYFDSSDDTYSWVDRD